MAKPKMSVFPTESDDGKKLCIELLEFGRSRGWEVKAVEKGTQQSYFRACNEDDIVLFDGTREAGGRNNYGIANAQHMFLEHVLVVSRNYLPTNFVPLLDEYRSADAPDRVLRGSPVYPKSQDNASIMEWFAARIAELEHRNRLPRPRSETGIWGTVRAGKTGRKLFDEICHSQCNIFISYRSSYASTAEFGTLVNDLTRGRYHGGSPKTVRFIDPAEWAYENELMSAYRRWQLLSEIDRRFVGACDEVWVYKTDDYWQSWWTQGELLTMSYRRAAGSRQPKIVIYDPSVGPREAPPEYQPRMSHEQAKRMARWYSNCDRWSGGPEAAAVMRQIARLPLIGRLRYFHDPVWSEGFYSHYLIPAIMPAEYPASGFFDVQKFLWSEAPQNLELPREQVEAALRNGGVLTFHGQVCRLEQKALPRYSWMPTRGGVDTSGDGTHLREEPVIVRV